MYYWLAPFSFWDSFKPLLVEKLNHCHRYLLATAELKPNWSLSLLPIEGQTISRWEPNLCRRCLLAAAKPQLNLSYVVVSFQIIMDGRYFPVRLESNLASKSFSMTAFTLVRHLSRLHTNCDHYCYTYCLPLEMYFVTQSYCLDHKLSPVFLWKTFGEYMETI